MMIDPNADVTPNRYESPLLRRTIGRRIGRASRDDMLRALLWASEVRIADEVSDAWHHFHERLNRALQEAERRQNLLSWEPDDRVVGGCRTAVTTLLAGLRQECHSAAEAAEHSTELARELKDWLGAPPGDRADLLTDTRVALASLHGDLPAARDRFKALMDENKAELHDLAILEQKRLHATGPSLLELGAMQQDEFDAVIQRALERSGFQTLHREPRVIEVSRAGRKGLVYCANTQTPKTDEMVHLRDLVSVQRLATAGDFGIVLLVSNLPYMSRAALRFIDTMSCSVEHLDSFDLQQWIEWGMPLRAVVES
ncbi:hypothetical protein [Streptomyces xanthophaeus]|uniref:hypothetical protein n=1 Tax=Streptomyces xanthophaeus TaxID=67385 RepID=UPI003669EB99